MFNGEWGFVVRGCCFCYVKSFTKLYMAREDCGRGYVLFGRKCIGDSFHFVHIILILVCRSQRKPEGGQ